MVFNRGLCHLSLTFHWLHSNQRHLLLIECLVSRQQTCSNFEHGKWSDTVQIWYILSNQMWNPWLLRTSIMCTSAIIYQHVRTNILMLPWRLVKKLKFWDLQKICGPIPFHFSWGLAAKYWPFRAKWGFKVRISRFPWQPIGIFKFRFREARLWTRQIVCARFRRDPSRNQGGVVHEPSPAHKISHKNWLLLYRLGAWPSPRVLSMGWHHCHTKNFQSSSGKRNKRQIDS